MNWIDKSKFSILSIKQNKTKVGSASGAQETAR